MKILLSPSKALNFDKKIIDNYTTPRFLDDSEVLIDELKQLSKEDISSLMRLSANLTELNYDRYQSFQTPFTTDNSKPAAFTFTGNVYDGLSFNDLSSEDVEFAQGNLRILSGLYGILKPLDLMQLYRLEMGTRLKNARGKNLYEFWGAKISEYLNAEESDIIINLASNEYSKVIDKKSLKAKIISPSFKEFKNGKYKMLMAYVKKARGLMANYIIKNQIDNAKSINSFNVDGYFYNEELSTSNEPVFTR